MLDASLAAPRAERPKRSLREPNIGERGVNINVQAWMREARMTKRKRVILRPVGPTVALRTALNAVSTRILREARSIVIADVLPAALSARSQLQRKDLNWFERAMRTLRQLLDGLIDGARQEFREAFETEDERHRRRFNEAARSAIGIDLVSVIRSEGIEALIAASVQRNVSLIRGLSDDLAKRLASSLLSALVQGASNREIAKILTKEFGFSAKRAHLIARDQAGSFSGDLNRVRQTEAGVKEYSWSTSLDERVRGNPEGRYPNARPSHWTREGKTFKWSSPPSDGHPGQPINCHCTARAVIEF